MNHPQVDALLSDHKADDAEVVERIHLVTDSMSARGFAAGFVGQVGLSDPLCTHNTRRS